MAVETVFVAADEEIVILAGGPIGNTARHIGIRDLQKAAATHMYHDADRRLQLEDAPLLGLLHALHRVVGALQHFLARHHHVADAQ
jgi:hypothetical protein